MTNRFTNEFANNIAAALPGNWIADVSTSFVYKEAIIFTREDGMHFMLSRIPTGTGSNVRYEARALTMRDDDNHVIDHLVMTDDGWKRNASEVGCLPEPNWGNPMDKMDEVKIADVLVRRLLKEFEEIFAVSNEARVQMNESIARRRETVGNLEFWGFKLVAGSKERMYRVGETGSDVTVRLGGKIDMKGPFYRLSVDQVSRILAIVNEEK